MMSLDVATGDCISPVPNLQPVGQPLETTSEHKPGEIFSLIYRSFVWGLKAKLWLRLICIIQWQFLKKKVTLFMIL